MSTEDSRCPLIGSQPCSRNQIFLIGTHFPAQEKRCLGKSIQASLRLSPDKYNLCEQLKSIALETPSDTLKASVCLCQKQVTFHMLGKLSTVCYKLDAKNHCLYGLLNPSNCEKELKNQVLFLSWYFVNFIQWFLTESTHHVKILYQLVSMPANDNGDKYLKSHTMSKIIEHRVIGCEISLSFPNFGPCHKQVVCRMVSVLQASRGMLSEWCKILQIARKDLKNQVLFASYQLYKWVYSSGDFSLNLLIMLKISSFSCRSPRSSHLTKTKAYIGYNERHFWTLSRSL